MVQHYLLGPTNLKFRIFSSPDIENSTNIGKNPTRIHTLQRKLVLYDDTLKDNHVNIKPLETRAIIKPLTPDGIVKVNGEEVKYETALEIKNRDIIQFGNGTYRYIIQHQPKSRFLPVIDQERYLKNLKKNINYKASNLHPRK